MTVDESIASMKRLMKKIRALPTFYRVDCGGCNDLRNQYCAFRRCSIPEPSALKLNHRVMRIFYCLPARSPVQCDPLRCVRGSRAGQIIISYGACINGGRIFHILPCGAVRCVFRGCPAPLPTPPAAVRLCGSARRLLKIHARGQVVDRQPAEFCIAIWCSRCAAVDREARRLAVIVTVVRLPTASDTS